jgi:DNA modification methylase
VTSVKDLKSDHKNARRRTDRSASLIAESLKRFGAARSIVIDEDGRILAGNGTVEGAKKAGIDKLRIIEAEGDELIAVRRAGLTEDQKVGLALADNRSSDLSEWDNEMLRQLSEEHDLTPWFEDDELLAEVLEPEEGKTDPDDVPETPEEPITKPGDLWILGNHRLLCGDSTSLDEVEKLMAGAKADLLHTDPPYGVSYDGKGGQKQWEMIKNDAMVEDGLVDFLVAAFNCANLSLKDKAAWYVWHGYKGTCEFYEALKLAGKKPGAQIVWVKNGLGTMWSNYRPKHECAIYVSGEFYGGYDQSTVWDVARERNYVHPTQKPVELVERALINSSKKGQLVLDLFGGSGSTLIACEQEHRHCRMMELDPIYCDVIVKRWENFTGKKAMLEETKEAF